MGLLEDLYEEHGKPDSLQTFGIEDDHLIRLLEALSIWSEKDFKKLGYVDVKEEGSLHYVFITEEGKAYAKTIDNPLCVLIEREADEDKTVH